MNPITQQSLFLQGPGAESATSSPTAARLQVIHDLIRSGDYHIPATAIADRMIEKLMDDKREADS